MSPAERNGKGWLSRSFWIVGIFGGLGFALSWKLGNPVPFTTVASVGLGGWFGGKWAAGKANG